MSRIVFFADGGAAIGSGHVMRCLALASVFANGGWKVSFAVNAEASETVAALSQSGHEVAILPDGEAEEAAALVRCWPGGTDIFVVDHYGRGAAFERACRPWAKRIVVIDDLANRPYDADALADAGNPAEAYGRLVPPGCAVLAGLQYAIVHSKFRGLREQTLLRRDGCPVERVLVSFGQIDAPNATACALEALKAADFAGEVDVVLGSAAPHLADVRAQAGGRVRLHVDTDEMAALMSAADLAVGAGGGTAWERCCLGLPTVLVEIAENQRGVIATLLAAQAGMDAGMADEGLAGRIGERLRGLLQNAGLRRDMAARAASLVDGRGALRILFAAIGSEAARDGAAVTLRAAEHEDENWLLELQRKPETRRHANDSAPPKEEDHRRWFARTLSDAGRRLAIVRHGEWRSGMIRLDRGADAVRVSIAIDPAFHRLGVGAAALALAARVMPGSSLEAEILPENGASKALFSAAGYRQVSAKLFRRDPA